MCQYCSDCVAMKSPILPLVILLSIVQSLSSQNVKYKFPDYFKFGSATAAYQVEGAWNVSGKGPSIWDTVMHRQPNHVDDKSTGDDAAKSYYLFREDIKAMKEMGMNIYKFSISWPRILPFGDLTNIQQEGLRYYDTLINELLANNIEPIVTLYHWDLPQELQNIGGWTNPLIVDYFMLYVGLVFDHYADRVKTWITFNDGISICEGGYGDSWNAPLIRIPGIAGYICGHHVLIAHAKAYHLYRERYHNLYKGKIGISIKCDYIWPKNASFSGDIAAAERAIQFSCGWFGHPIFSKKGGYPDAMVSNVNRKSLEEGRAWSRLPVMADDLKEYIRGTADFWGMNYFTGALAAQPSDYGEPSRRVSYKFDQEAFLSISPNWPMAQSPWLYSVPEGLRSILNWVKDEYDNPEVLITENGWSDLGMYYNQSYDVFRILYLKRHFNAILDAIYEDDCNVVGHITWSLIDNLEWYRGFTEKFGLYHVDFNDPERKRTAKESAIVLAEVIKTRLVPDV